MNIAELRYRFFATGVIVLHLAACSGVMSTPSPQVAMQDLGPAIEDEKLKAQVRVETLVKGLENPWGMDFLPDGKLLVTEKSGHLKLIDLGSDSVLEVSGMPVVADAGQGGLMDVLVHPQFDSNGLVYFSYATEQEGLFSTRVSRARLHRDTLQGWEVLFTAQPFFKERRHFGSRLLLDGGYLYITVGDRGNRDMAQGLGSHNGKVLRLTAEGGIPEDNPFTKTPGALPEIWSYGHRNPQGIALNSDTGEVWVSEHGPQGGDEVNRLTRGANYGWPVITYGEEYGGGKIGVGTHQEGMEQPLSYYSPSIGAAGMDFYLGDIYPGWKPSLLISGLRQTQIARLELEENGVGKRTHLLSNLGMRIRDVQVGPDGLVYALTGGSRLIRLHVEH